MAAHEVLKISRNIALQGRKEFESGRTPQPRVEKLISPVRSGLHVDYEEILVRNRSKRYSVLTPNAFGISSVCLLFAFTYCQEICYDGTKLRDLEDFY